MSNIRVLGAHIGWKDTSRPALNDGRTEVYPNDKPVTLRGKDQVQGGSLAEALDSAGAQYGDELIVIAGSKEKVQEITVLNLANQEVLDGIDAMLESGLGTDELVSFLRSVSEY